MWSDSFEWPIKREKKTLQQFVFEYERGLSTAMCRLEIAGKFDDGKLRIIIIINRNVSKNKNEVKWIKRQCWLVYLKKTKRRQNKRLIK